MKAMESIDLYKLLDGCMTGGVSRYSWDAIHLRRRAEYSSNTFVIGSYSYCDVMSLWIRSSGTDRNRCSNCFQ